MAKASGTVYRSDSKERIPGASVKVSKGERVLFAIADDDGDFEIDVPEPGEWELVALDEDSFPNPPIKLDLTKDRAGIKIDLKRLTGEADESAGKTTFTVLLIVFGVLIALYLVLHIAIPEDAKPLSQASLASLALVQEQIQAGETGAAGDGLEEALADLESDLQQALNRSNVLSQGDRGFIGMAVEQIRDALAEDQDDRAVGLLADLYQAIDPAPNFGFWSANPLRFLEILLWGLGGILVNKLILIGWYVRSHRFYREGVLMHISHIVTTPVLVLVTVLLLSLATMTFTLTGGNELTVDLSAPPIMAAFAFIIGTSPWPLWRLIENASKRFTSYFD